MIANLTNCACGLPMRHVNERKTVQGCMNCDTVQPSEYGENGHRAITVHDRRFKLTWAGRERAVYGK